MYIWNAPKGHYDASSLVCTFTIGVHSKSISFIVRFSHRFFFLRRDKIRRVESTLVESRIMLRTFLLDGILRHCESFAYFSRDRAPYQALCEHRDFSFWPSSLSCFWPREVLVTTSFRFPSRSFSTRDSSLGLAIQRYRF